MRGSFFKSDHLGVRDECVHRPPHPHSAVNAPTAAKPNTSAASVSRSPSAARKFRSPTSKKVRVLIDGKPQRVWASTKALKTGIVVKRLKRSQTYKHTAKAEAA